MQVNDEYGVHESRRDAACAELLAQQGVAFKGHLDQPCFFQPGSLLTQPGTYFQVYVSQGLLPPPATALPRCLPRPAAQAPLPIVGDALPTEIDGFPHPQRQPATLLARR